MNFEQIYEFDKYNIDTKFSSTPSQIKHLMQVM